MTLNLLGLSDNFRQGAQEHMRQPPKRYALCVDTAGYETSLREGRLYRLIPDSQANEDEFVRVIDESGEDYLFHKNHFAFIEPAV